MQRRATTTDGLEQFILVPEGGERPNPARWERQLGDHGQIRRWAAKSERDLRACSRRRGLGWRDGEARQGPRSGGPRPRRSSPSSERAGAGSSGRRPSSERSGLGPRGGGLRPRWLAPAAKRSFPSPERTEVGAVRRSMAWEGAEGGQIRAGMAREGGILGIKNDVDRVFVKWDFLFFYLTNSPNIEECSTYYPMP